MTFRGKHLFVNVDAPAGELRAEVLDERGQVIAPFSAGELRPGPGRQDAPGRCVEGRRATWPRSPGKPVRFRFHLQRTAKLYAFWVSPEASGASHGYVAAGGPGFTGPTDTVGSSPA